MSALSEAATAGSRLRPDQSDGGEEEKERSQSDVAKEKKMQTAAIFRAYAKRKMVS